MNVGVMASGEGTNLQALLDRLHGREGVRIVAVASDQPSARALERARQARVATEVFAQADYSDRAERDLAVADWLAGHQVELVVLAGYMQLLSGAFLERFPQRVINVHPALLPAFTGLEAVRQALDYGAKVVGVTVHFVDGGVDTGPVILQRALQIEPSSTVEEVSGLLHPIEHDLLTEAVALMAAGRVELDREHPRRVLIDR